MIIEMEAISQIFKIMKPRRTTLIKNFTEIMEADMDATKPSRSNEGK